LGQNAFRVNHKSLTPRDRVNRVLQEIRLLGKRICEFHFKDSYRKYYDGSRILSQAKLDFHAVRAAIEEIGYHGWVLIEVDTKPDEAPAVPKENLTCLKTLFPA